MNKKAQASLEFTLVFVITILLVVLTANVFVWLNHCMVRRQVEYEKTRTAAGSSDVGKSDFFAPGKQLPKLNVFISGGISKK